jgi:hypothetical protein
MGAPVCRHNFKARLNDILDPVDKQRFESTKSIFAKVENFVI